MVKNNNGKHGVLAKIFSWPPVKFWLYGLILAFLAALVWNLVVYIFGTAFSLINLFWKIFPQTLPVYLEYIADFTLIVLLPIAIGFAAVKYHFLEKIPVIGQIISVSNKFMELLNSKELAIYDVFNNCTRFDWVFVMYDVGTEHKTIMIPAAPGTPTILTTVNKNVLEPTGIAIPGIFAFFISYGFARQIFEAYIREETRKAIGRYKQSRKSNIS